MPPFSYLAEYKRAGVIAAAVVVMLATGTFFGSRQSSRHTSSTPANVQGLPGEQAFVETTALERPRPSQGPVAADRTALSSLGGPSIADENEQVAQASSYDLTPITITGCLERADQTFRLRDTTGTDAPRARSWKWGFLKKEPASIHVVDSTHRANLPEHVGQRVSVTGTMVNREMTVRSLHRVSPSCSSGV